MEINEKDYEFKVTAAGRVNIIGEHVDYCGGKVFPAALSLKNTIYVKRNGTNKITPTTITKVVTIALTATDNVEIISFSGVPTSVCAISLAFIAQGIFIFVRLPVKNER